MNFVYVGGPKLDPADDEDYWHECHACGRHNTSSDYRGNDGDCHCGAAYQKEEQAS